MSEPNAEELRGAVKASIEELKEARAALLSFGEHAGEGAAHLAMAFLGSGRDDLGKAPAIIQGKMSEMGEFITVLDPIIEGCEKYAANL